MKKKQTTNRRAKKEPKVITFNTAQEVTNYFFPGSKLASSLPGGRERGTKAAENAFCEISKRLEA